MKDLATRDFDADPNPGKKSHADLDPDPGG